MAQLVPIGCLGVCFFCLQKNAQFLKVLQIRVPKIDDFPSTPTLLVSGDLGHIFSPAGPAFLGLNSRWGMFPSSSKVGFFHGRYRICVKFLRSNLGVTSFQRRHLGPNSADGCFFPVENV